jgi:hypothetical protein
MAEMEGPHLLGKVALVVAAAGLTAFGIRFYRKQKAGALGGAISRPKAFWLPFAIYLWFVVAGVMGLDPALPWSVRAPFLALAVSMWIRGAIEMVMLYGTKNWKPPYGIAHDVFTIGVMVIVTGLWPPAVGQGVSLRVGVALVMWVVMVASLVLEIVHARTFFLVVGPRTMGAAGIWFADDEDPRFLAINRRTRLGNIALGVPTALWVLLWLVS